MPVVLRSRKSIGPKQSSEAESRTRTPRRSTRLHSRLTYEDFDESDSESVQDQVMETRQSPPAEMEEDTAEETDSTELKLCSVVLDRLWTDDKAAKQELEDKEDMNRKAGKPVSRIPTFHKRPSGTSQSTELNVSKKDIPAHGAQSTEKAGSGSGEPSKSKLPDVRALLPPLVRVPKIGFEAPSAFIGTEHVGAVSLSSSTTTNSQGLSESVHHPFMTVSPRPSLRPQQESEHLVALQAKTLETEAEKMPDAPISHLPCEGSISHKSLEDTEERCNVAESAEVCHRDQVNQVEDIMDEEPPWEAEQMDIPDLKDSRSSSDAEYEDDSPPETCEGQEQGSDEVQEHRETLASQSKSLHGAKESGSTESVPTAAPEKPAKASTTKSTKRGGCCSFGLLCVMPTLLLLLGGFGQHVWHYGLPMSVAQLVAQLELHMLEGFSLVPEPCSADCRVTLVESIPAGLYENSPLTRQSIADSWLHLLHKANSSVNIAAFYFTLRGTDLGLAAATDSQGRMVFEQLKQLESKGVKLQIAVNAPQTSTQDTAELAATGAEVTEVDLQVVTGGIVHTKLWVVDQKHFYLGSANMDWRSLSQVKEVGLSVEDCSCLAQDAFRIFGVYRSLGNSENNGSLPPYWPARLSALSSAQNPLHLKFNGVPAQVYLSSAPPQISARGRTDDLAAILSVIDDAQKFVYISVMDYVPLSQFTEPHRFWPAIDSALRAAACTRKVQVRMLASCWEHSPGTMFIFLQSLLVLNRPPLKCDIEVKIFTVPSTAEQMKIPFARVNHAKYMVTDRVVYIGTSNWSENYFTQTAGVGLVVNQTGSVVRKGQETLQRQAEELFLADWTSHYASVLSVDNVDVCPRGPH